MARVTVEDCLENIDNRFALVILAAQRARQLLKGATPTVDAAKKQSCGYRSARDCCRPCLGA